MSPTNDGPSDLEASDDAVTPTYYGVVDRATAEQTALAGMQLDSLVRRSSARLEPDWDAWAHILSFGAPLAGRTPFVGFKRLQPAEKATRVDGDWLVSATDWAWARVTPDSSLEPEDLTADVLDALREEIRAATGPVHPMLSGGRDSRLLTALAIQVSDAATVSAWTTSSDTGTSLEELVAAKVARSLEVSHMIIQARHDRFSDDVREYARAVDYMASFHIWLMPVAEALARQTGVILDGLGGGVFLGGGFPDLPTEDHSPSSKVETRFKRLGRYLEAGPQILAPGVTEELEARSFADFERVARDYAEHPNGATLTAYLTRTLPGISLAPSKVLGSALPTLTPITGTEVVTRALRISPAKKEEGAWYQDLLSRADSRLRGMPTAADLTRRRHHARRGASRDAASWYRGLILGSPASALLSEEMRDADVTVWSEELSRTKPQHLIRGLALLALWLEDYGSMLTSVTPPYQGAAT